MIISIDSYTIYTLDKIGVIPIIFTGRTSEIVERRAAELKIVELYQGVSNKLSKLKEVIGKYNGSLEEVAYIGDDYNDLECIKGCGFSCCPYDAEPDIKPYVDYVCSQKGGEGALREFVKQIEIFNN